MSSGQQRYPLDAVDRDDADTGERHGTRSMWVAFGLLTLAILGLVLIALYVAPAIILALR